MKSDDCGMKKKAPRPSLQVGCLSKHILESPRQASQAYTFEQMQKWLGNVWPQIRSNNTPGCKIRSDDRALPFSPQMQVREPRLAFLTWTL